eukprot:631100-Rhodomonas_salina.1
MRIGYAGRRVGDRPSGKDCMDSKIGYASTGHGVRRGEDRVRPQRIRGSNIRYASTGHGVGSRTST